ncbi:M28 family peptidase [Streptomyces sp. RFCAC02]|uniref:M28 family peptidase n=1 Tax=Streptomyces sp. RFCAC02 TaxID=2499143 RepID=UPI001F0F14B8|nr:M28 family peptidase [Streptomyces sp. RFCAC02]
MIVRTARATAVLTATAALAAVPLLLGAAPATPPAPAPHDRAEVFARALADATTADGALRHLAEFQRIADASGGHRAAGSPGHEESARYAGRLLEAAGYDVTHQRFTFDHREPLTERLTQLTPDERAIPVRTLTYTPATPDGGIQAPLADAGTACAPSPAGTYTGRIALIERGDCTFAEKQANAAAGGALAALVRNNTAGELSGTLGDPAAGRIPTGGITREDGTALADALAAGETVTVRLELAELAEERETVNVIADSPGGDPRRTVMAGAHLDSVPDGPGINDNGSGSAALLETALRLAEADPAGRAPHHLRFALWSAEESGLAGSEHYVEHLPGGASDAIALYLNFDMLASPNHGLFVLDGDPAIAGDLTELLRAEGADPEATALDGRSDHTPFIDAGIPAGGVFTGAEGIKTPAGADRWGGTADSAYDPCYHRPCDDLDNIGRPALTVTARVVAHAVGRYAWSLPGTAR